MLISGDVRWNDTVRGDMRLIQKNLERKVRNNGGVSVPEMRFEVLFYGAFLTPIGLMIFAWTCYRHVHWIGTMFGSAIFGAGVFYVFVGIFNYTVDAYKRYAASGLACNSFVRCIMAGVFPLFGYDVPWNGCKLGWISDSDGDVDDGTCAIFLYKVWCLLEIKVAICLGWLMNIPILVYLFAGRYQKKRELISYLHILQIVEF